MAIMGSIASSRTARATQAHRIWRHAILLVTAVLVWFPTAGASRADALPERYRPLIINIGVLSNVKEYETSRDGHEEFGYSTSKVASNDSRFSELGTVGVVFYVEPKGKGPARFTEIVGVFSSAMETGTAVALGDEAFLGTNLKGYVRQYIVRVGDTIIMVGGWGKTDPRTVLDPILAHLGVGIQPLTAGEIAFRNVLFSTGLKFRGDAARSCLDEVMNTAEATAAKDPKPKMADEIAQLRKAAAGAHAIEVLAAVPVGPAHFDDFDPKWWDALKEVVPNPTSAPDPQDTATDRVIDLLPPPLNVLVNIVRTGSKTMRAIKTHIADPAVHREVYACYRRKREGSGGTPIGENIGQAALESEAAQILHDAIGAGCNAPNSFKNSYEAQLRKFTSKEARENEFTRLLRPLAVRFEFIYRVEDAKAHRETLIAGRWAPAQDILARLKVRVNACIADRASKSR